MPMEKWSHFPGVFRRNILLTGLTGAGCGGIAAVVYIVSKDRTLLMLGCMILVICICKAVSYWNCAAREHYHVLSGLCKVPKGYSPLRLRKVLLIHGDGNETTLLLDRKAGIKDGLCYRLYFQNCEPATTGNEELDAAICSDMLIGLEEIDPEELES